MSASASASDKTKNLQLVKVFLRQRPMTRDEQELRRRCIVSETSEKEIILKSGSLEKKYEFDRVFNGSASQVEIYDSVVFPLIEHVLSGYTCSVLAYGQTGTGKTHTMIGKNISPNIDYQNDPSVGIVPRAANHIFSELTMQGFEHTVKVTFVELYNEEVRDLLVSDGMSLRVYDDPENKTSTCIQGLIEVVVTSTQELYDFLCMGVVERHTASTNLNRHSSRSHTIFTIIVHTREITKDGEDLIRTGKLHLIDLAGSENIGRSGATEARAREAGSINKSLLTLGKVIKALANKSPHVPYRESKLTRILRDSLGGKSKTSMIATFSPCIEAFDETISTLEYAHVARSVANCPTVNINRSQKNVLKDSHTEMLQLRQELNAARTGEGFYLNAESYEQMTDDIKAKNERIQNLFKQISVHEENIRETNEIYAELKENFENTQSQAAAVFKELEDEEAKEKLNMTVLRYNNGLIMKLHRKAEKLSEICDTATTHHDIYHEKYETQCDSTVSNGDVAEKVYCSTVNSLNEVQNASDHFVKAQMTDLNLSKCKIEVANEYEEKYLENTNGLLLDVNIAACNSNLNFDHLFRDPSYSQNKVQSDLSATLDEACQAKFQLIAEKTTDVLGNVQSFIQDKSAKIDARTIKCTNKIDQHFAEIKTQTANKNKLLHDILRDTIDRRSRVQEQLLRTWNIKKLQDELSQEITLTNEAIKEEIKTLTSTNKTVEKITSSARDLLKPLLSTKESLEHFNKRAVKTMASLAKLIDTNVKDIKSNRIQCLNKFEICAKEMKKCFVNCIVTFYRALDIQKEETQEILLNWTKELDAVNQDLRIDVNREILNQLENFEAVGATHVRDMKQFIEESIVTIEDMKKQIQTTIHEGDTPVKVEYAFPRAAQNRLSIEMLREEFRSMMDETDEDED